MTEKILGKIASVQQNNSLDKRGNKNIGTGRNRILQLLTTGALGYFAVQGVEAKNIDNNYSKVSVEESYNFSNIEVNATKKISAETFIGETSPDLFNAFSDLDKEVIETIINLKGVSVKKSEVTFGKNKVNMEGLSKEEFLGNLTSLLTSLVGQEIYKGQANNINVKDRVTKMFIQDLLNSESGMGRTPEDEQKLIELLKQMVQITSQNSNNYILLHPQSGLYFTMELGKYESCENIVATINAFLNTAKDVNYKPAVKAGKKDEPIKIPADLYNQKKEEFKKEQEKKEEKKEEKAKEEEQTKEETKNIPDKDKKSENVKNHDSETLKATQEAYKGQLIVLKEKQSTIDSLLTVIDTLNTNVRSLKELVKDPADFVALSIYNKDMDVMTDSIKELNRQLKEEKDIEADTVQKLNNTNSLLIKEIERVNGVNEQRQKELDEREAGMNNRDGILSQNEDLNMNNRKEIDKTASEQLIKAGEQKQKEEELIEKERLAKLFKEELDSISKGLQKLTDSLNHAKVGIQNEREKLDKDQKEFEKEKEAHKEEYADFKKGQAYQEKLRLRKKDVNKEKKSVEEREENITELEAQVQAKVSVVEGDMKKVQDELTITQNNLKEANNNVNELKRQLSRYEQNNKNLDEKVEATGGIVEKKDDENKELNDKLKNLQTKLSDAEISIKELKADKEKLENALKIAEGAAKTLKSELKSTEAITDKKGNEQSELVKKINELTNELAVKTTEIKNLQEKHSEKEKALNKEIEKLTTEIGNLNKQIKNKGEIVTDKDSEKNKISLEAKAAKEDLTKANIENDKLKADLKKMTDEKEKAEQEIASLQKKLDAEKNRVNLKEKDASEIGKENKGLKDQLSEKEKELNKEIEKLKIEVENLKKLIKSKEEIIADKESKKNEISLEAKAAKEDLTKASIANDKLTSDLKKMTDEKDKAVQEAAALQEKLDAEKNRSTSQEKDASEVEKENKSLRDKVTEKESAITQKENENKDLKKNIEKLNGTVDELEKKIEQYVAQITNSDAKNINEVVEFKSEIATLKQSITTLETASKAKDEEIKLLKDDIEAQKVAIENKEKVSGESEAKTREINENKINEFRNTIKEFEEKIAIMEANNKTNSTQTNQEISALKDQVKNLEADTTRLSQLAKANEGSILIVTEAADKKIAALQKSVDECAKKSEEDAKIFQLTLNNLYVKQYQGQDSINNSSNITKEVRTETGNVVNKKPSLSVADESNQRYARIQLEKDLKGNKEDYKKQYLRTIKQELMDANYDFNKQMQAILSNYPAPILEQYEQTVNEGTSPEDKKKTFINLVVDSLKMKASKLESDPEIQKINAMIEDIQDLRKKETETTNDDIIDYYISQLSEEKVTETGLTRSNLKKELLKALKE